MVRQTSQQIWRMSSGGGRSAENSWQKILRKAPKRKRGQAGRPSESRLAGAPLIPHIVDMAVTRPVRRMPQEDRLRAMEAPWARGPTGGPSAFRGLISLDKRPHPVAVSRFAL